MKRQAPPRPPRPSRRFTRLVLALRAAWLVPVTLMALAYAVYSLFNLGHMMRYPAGSAVAELLQAVFGAALGAAFLFFTWRMWRKTWDMLLDRIYPEPSAPYWQLGWLILAVVLPFLAVWPKVQDLLRYSGEGANKGNLAVLRQAVEAYRAARGVYPADLGELAGAGFVRKVPALWDKRGAGFPHRPTSAEADAERGPADTGRWAYSVKDGKAEIYIDCIHKDSRGRAWSSY